MVGKLLIGKAQSRKALREDRVGLDDIRRKTAHRVPDEPTSDRHPSRRLRESEKQRTLPPCVKSEDLEVALIWSMTQSTVYKFAGSAHSGAAPLCQ